MIFDKYGGQFTVTLQRMPRTDTLQQAADSTVFRLDLSWIPSPEEIHGKIDSVFSAGHTGSEEIFKLKEIDRSENYWPFAVLFLTLSLFAFVRINYHNKYKNLTAAFVNARYMKQMLREELVLTHPASIYLTIQYCVAAGFLLFSWIYYLDNTIINIRGLELFLLLTGLVLAFIITKTIITVVIQFITGEDNGQTENRYNFLLFNQLCGVILLPFVILAQFGPDYLFKTALFTGTFIITGVYIYRLFRSFLVGVSAGNTGFHLFLYLCTLEIIPLIVLIRLLVSEIG